MLEALGSISCTEKKENKKIEKKRKGKERKKTGRDGRKYICNLINLIIKLNILEPITKVKEKNYVTSAKSHQCFHPSRTNPLLSCFSSHSPPQLFKNFAAFIHIGQQYNLLFFPLKFHKTCNYFINTLFLS
jgi:hypothetical protein